MSSAQRTHASWRDQYTLLRRLYKWWFPLLFVWIGSRTQVRLILKFLHCGTCPRGPTALLEAQNRNVTTASLGSSIAALIAITSFLFPFTNQVHWLSRAFWTFSVLSSFLSAAFACKHNRFISSVLLEGDTDLPRIRRWFRRCPGNDDKNIATGVEIKIDAHSNGDMVKSTTEKIINDDTNKPDNLPAVPRLSIVLLLSGTKMFFDSAVIAYAIGMGIYLGSVWLQDLDTDTDQSDSRNVFIVFIVSIVLCAGLYFSLDYVGNPCEEDDWHNFLNLFPPHDLEEGRSHAPKPEE